MNDCTAFAANAAGAVRTATTKECCATEGQIDCSEFAFIGKGMICCNQSVVQTTSFETGIASREDIFDAQFSASNVEVNVVRATGRHANPMCAGENPGYP